MLNLPIVILSLSSLLTRVSPCLEQSLTTEWRSNDELDQLRVRAREDSDTLVLITRDFVFNCRGSIEQWRLQWHHRSAECPTISFTFYALRETGECSYQVVGFNSFTGPTVQNSGSDVQNADTTFSVDLEDGVMVEEGDFIGVKVELRDYNTCSPEARIWVAGRMDLQNRVYHNTFSTQPNGVFSQACGSLILNQSIHPFITAVVSRRSMPTSSLHTTVKPTIPVTTTSDSTTSVHTSSLHPAPKLTATVATKSSTRLTPTTITRLLSGHSCSSPREATASESPQTPTTTTNTGSTPAMDSRAKKSEHITHNSPDTSTINFSSGVNTTQSSSDEWLILVVGGTSCALFILVITITTIVLCVVRCLQTKHGNGEKPTDREVHKQDTNKRESSPWLESDIDYEDPTSSSIGNVHTYDYPHALIATSTLKELNICQSVPDTAGSLQKGEDFTMKINKAYGAMPIHAL